MGAPCALPGSGSRTPWSPGSVLIIETHSTPERLPWQTHMAHSTPLRAKCPAIQESGRCLPHRLQVRLVWGRVVLGRVMLTHAGQEGSLVPSRHDGQGGKPNTQVCPWLAPWLTAPTEAFLATRISPTSLWNQMPLIPRDI